MTDGIVTISCMCGSIVAIALIVAFSHNRLTASFQAAWNGKSASVVISPVASPVLSPGGSGSYGSLAWLPRWKQTGGLLPDGALDPQEDNDCGETCVAMVVAAVRGVVLAPGDIRQQLGGVGRSGLTSPEDLVRALALNHVSSHVEKMDTEHAWILNAGCYAIAKPNIALGYWLNMSCMHWMLLADKLPAQFVFVDPWTGSLRALTLQMWRAQYCQATVVIDDHLMFDMHLVATPGTGPEA